MPEPENELKDKNILIFCADTEMGEWLGRYDNDKSAMVILAGKDEAKLEEISNDLFLASDSFVMETISESSIRDVLDYCQKKEIKLDGVVIPADISSELLSYLSSELVSGYGNEYVSVVVLESASSEDELDIKRHEMETKLKGTGRKEEERCISVNGITYVYDQVKIIQVTGNGQEWVELYLEKGCPELMEKSIHLARMQRLMLEGLYRCTTETVIALNN